jgi:hypothetical protein
MQNKTTIKNVHDSFTFLNLISVCIRCIFVHAA